MKLDCYCFFPSLYYSYLSRDGKLLCYGFLYFLHWIADTLAEVDYVIDTILYWPRSEYQRDMKNAFYLF